MRRLICFIPFLLIILRTEDCEIFNYGNDFWGTWVLRRSSWEQIISSMVSSFSGVAAVCEQPELLCLSTAPNASNLFYESLHQNFVPALLWIIFPFCIWCVSFFMMMFDNRLICVRKNYYFIIKYLQTRCSLHVDRSLISDLNIIMANG